MGPTREPSVGHRAIMKFLDPRAIVLAISVVIAACTLLSELTGWRTGICCFAAMPLTPGPLPESASRYLGGASGGGFKHIMGNSWDEVYKSPKTDGVLKKRGIPWPVRVFLGRLKGSPRFKLEGKDTVVMMTKIQPLGLVVSMRFPPKSKPQITEKLIPLPGFPVQDRAVSYHSGGKFIVESTVRSRARLEPRPVRSAAVGRERGTLRASGRRTL